MAHFSQHTASVVDIPLPRGSRTVAGWRGWTAREGLGLLVMLLSGAIFAVDLLLPLGIAGGVPYVAPVLLTMWLPTRRYILPAALVCSVLTLAGLLLSAPGAPLWAVIPNRVLALLAVWTVALLALERKRAEEALSESEALTRAVLATTAEGILTLDGDGRIVATNPAAQHMFGRPAAELAKQSLGDLLGPPDCALFDRDAPAYLRRTASEAATTHEVVGRRSDQATFPLELALVPLELPKGVQYTATLRDISERRHLEHHLLRTNEEERRAVGYGLHEELGQTLTGLSLLSHHLARRLEEHHPAEAREAAELATLLHDADVLALRLFNDLVPVDASSGPVEALSHLVREAASKYGARYTVEGKGTLSLADDVHAPQLYRIVHDLVHEMLPRGNVRDVTLWVGAGEQKNGLTLCFQGEALPDTDDLNGVMQRLTYRARLIGARLETEVEMDGKLSVCVSL